MIPVFSILLATAAVLPIDRLAMADRLFSRGRYAEAAAEYEALAGESSLAADEILCRRGECARLMGRSEEAVKAFERLVEDHPRSKYCNRAKLLLALSLPERSERRIRLLKDLDAPGVDKSMRSAALYHLGVDVSDTNALERAYKIDSSGRYAVYAQFRLACALGESKDAAVRRRSVEMLLDIAFGKGELADDALYMAASRCFNDQRHSEAQSLLSRYLKKYPGNKNCAEARVMLAWSCFYGGKYSEAVKFCEGGSGEDFDMIRAASAFHLMEHEKAIGLFRKYLADHPRGNMRKEAEFLLARLEYDVAVKGEKWTEALEASKRALKHSKNPADALRHAWVVEKGGNAEEAIRLYRELAGNHPGSAEAAEALFRKAMVDAGKERWPAVDVTLAEALATGKLGRFRPQALYWRAVAAVKLGHEESAAKLFAEAETAGLSLDLSREARLAMAFIDLNAGRVEAAKPRLSELVRQGAAERMSASQVYAAAKVLDAEDSLSCARYLSRSDSPQWRQIGFWLVGDIEERRSAYSAAVEAYRQSLKETVRTPESATAVLALGKLETRLGEYVLAEATLKEAVKLNADDRKRRAEAYVALAANQLARGDKRSAKAYATVVVTLFEGESACAEAQKIISDAGGDEK